MKKINLIGWLSRNSHEKQKPQRFARYAAMLIMLLTLGVGQMWGQAFGTVGQHQTTMQSQQIMSGGAYSGTVYEPFSNTTPASYSPSNAPVKHGGIRKATDSEGNWVPDAQDLETAGDTGNSNESPIGEPWVMLLMALAFAGVITCRQYKRKTVKTMNMKKSTKFIAALALLLTVGTVNMRAYEQLYLVGAPCGGSWDTKTYAMPEKGETGQRVIYIYMTANDRFRFMIHHTWDGGSTWYDKPVGESTIKEMDGLDSEKDCRLYMWSDNTPQAAKFTGNTGIISVNTYQKDQNDNPWVALRRTTIKIRHNWGHASGDNTGWSDQTMTDNNDGTYTYTGNYGYNLTYVGSRDYDSNDNGSNFFKKFENIATVYGSPSAGDACLFEYNANGYASIGSSTTYRGTLYIRKLSSITYNGNGKESGTVPSTQSNLPAGVAVSLAGAGTLSRSNYTLSGWNTAADGSGTHYNLGAEITPNGSDLTLYAEWKQEVDLLKGTNGTADGSSDVAIYLNATSLASHTNATRTGYDLTGYWTAASGGTQIVNANGSTFVKNVSGYTDSDGKWNRTGSISDLTAQWTAHVYTMTLKHGLGGTGSDGSLTVAYDATAKSTMSYSFTNTGYHISGWYPSQESDLKVLETDGTFAANNVSGYITSGKWSKTSNGDLHAHWAGNSFTVQFDANGGSGAAMANQNFTYNTEQNLRTNTYYKDGYSFDGWALTEDGDVIYTDGADGCKITTTDGETVTLYAHWTQATITNLTFTPSSPAPEGDVAITPVFDHEPTGTTIICYELHSNSTATAEVPGTTFAVNLEDSKVHFNAPSASGTYYVKATFRTGSSCSGGTTLNTIVVPIVISSDHTVTVRYMCDGVAIHAPSEYVVPAGETLEITALEDDDVFGYSFDSWALGDGINQESVDGGTITISAFFNGVLTANYTKKGMILFKNTLGWSDVWVHFLGSSYWDATEGTGNQSRANRNKHMTRLGETDIWYFDYGTADISPTGYEVFTDREYTGSGSGYGNFHGTSSSDKAPVVYPIVRDNSEDLPYGFNAGTPMFVPLTGQSGMEKTVDSDGNKKAMYYNKGYWRKNDASSKTGYTLEIYDKTISTGRNLLYSIPLTEASDGSNLFEAAIDLEAGKTYGVKFLRDNSWHYTHNDVSFSQDGSYIDFGKQDDDWAACGLNTTVAGEYAFHLACGNDGILKLAVTFPAAANDYRVVYQDAAHNTDRTQHFSRTITKQTNADDIVSFFIDKDNSESMKFQYISNIVGSTVTWTDVTGGSINLSSFSDVITQDGVYNFYVHQDGSGNISVTKVEPYTGDFYIRTDLVGGTKWADYQNAAHLMAYSQYSEENNYFSHYWMAYSTGSYKDNVKFVVANDYSPWVSDTIIKQASEVALIDENGVNAGDVNIRFSYDRKTNVAKRTYLAASYASDFLVLKNDAATSSEEIYDATGETDKSGLEITFNDRENYIYDITAQVKPSAAVRVKVCATYNSNVQSLIGDASSDDFTSENSKLLLNGSSSSLQTIRIMYDFKTNRIVSAWQAAGTITGELEIDADLMIVREHQEAADNIILAHDDLSDTDGKITTEKRIYAVMRFNRWILNNLANPNDKEADHARTDNYTTYHPALAPGAQLPTYQRNLYYISFPFDVNVSDIFGFGTYGTHYAIQRYDGIGRATNGYWVDSEPNWKWVPPTGKLNAYEGYVLSLSLSNMAVTNTNVWANNSSEVELYFPSAEEGFTINTENVTINALTSIDGNPYHCTIERDNRTVKDSYWRCIGVPSFANYSGTLSDGTNTINWQTSGDGVPFIYDINWQDKSLTAYQGTNFPFKAMHSYLVQYGGAINWSNVVRASSIVARERNENASDYTYRLELRQGETFGDQTFVRMTDKEGVTNAFDFDQDLWKQKYGSRANIYTLIGDVEVAGNSMPMSEQKVVVPVGVQIAADGDYTFAMPDGTNGVGVTLVDTETGIRTSLSALDYTINLSAGTYDNRFVLEISPINNTPTNIDNVKGNDEQGAKVRKVLIDGVLYIVKDGAIFDATGARIK